MAGVTLANIRKVYTGNVEAVQGFTLDIRDGEFLVLVGPSGCGKSTVLRIVAGLEEATSGTVSIGGRVVNDVHPKDRDIAMVFQNYALYPHMTVRKIMGFALKLRGTPKAEVERRVVETAKALGLEEFLDRRPGQLSGGQRQRVALGRAIIREPKAFLFDEPLSNLDAKLRVTTRAELKALHQRLKTTSIYVTHDQEEAMTLGDRIVVMSRGLIQQADTPLTVYRKPANRFVAGFIGTPPMNFLDGRIVGDGADVAFESAFKGADGTPFRLRPAPDHATALARHNGKEVVLGLRPQTFGVPANATPGGSWPVRVDVVEPLGESMDISCSLGSQRIVARLPADAVMQPGQATTLAIRTVEAHWFEPGDFGKSLLS